MADVYDAIIIGSGQGGTPLAVKLADQGWEVVLIEKDRLGGTCVNVGCTPTKTLVASARAAHVAQTGGDLGVKAEVTVDFETVMERKDRIVSSFREGVQDRVDREGLTLVRGEARFEGPRTIRAVGTELQSDRIVINAGQRPLIPPIDGLDDVDYLTSTDLLGIDRLPDHLLVVGGGYVGCEFAQMFRRFGSKVTIVEGDERLLLREDEDISREVESVFEREGIRVETGSRVQSVGRSEGTVVVESEDLTLSGDELLVATGRRSNADRLAIEEAGIELDEGGNVPVDEAFRTDQDGIWAIGDVTGNAPFTNVSYHDHQILYEDWIEGGSDRTRPGERNVTHAVFVDPPVAGVGLNEREAREKEVDYRVASTPMTHVARGIETGETDGLLKVLVDPESRQILGASVMGIRADDIIHVFTSLMDSGSPYDVLEDMICVHPAVAEALPVLVRKLEE